MASRQLPGFYHKTGYHPSDRMNDVERWLVIKDAGKEREKEQEKEKESKSESSKPEGSMDNMKDEIHDL